MMLDISNSEDVPYCCGFCRNFDNIIGYFKWKISNIINYITNYSNYYEIKISIIGMTNSGKSTLVKRIEQISSDENNNIKKNNNSFGTFNEDTIPTLKMKTYNIILKNRYQIISEESENKNRTEDRNDIELFNDRPDDNNEENSNNNMGGFDILSNYIKSMKNINNDESNYKIKSIKSTKSVKSMKSNKTTYNENSPLLNNNLYEEGNEEDESLRNRITNNEKIIIKISDLSGQMRYSNLWKEQLLSKRSDCIIYVIDLSDILTLNESRNKLWELLKFNNSHDRIPFLIVGNKSDLVDWNNFFTYNIRNNKNIPNNKNNKSNERTDSINSKNKGIDIKRDRKKNSKILFDNSKWNDKQQLVMKRFGLSLSQAEDGIVTLDDGTTSTILHFELAVFIMSLNQRNCKENNNNNNNNNDDDDDDQEINNVIEWALGGNANTM